VKHELTAIKHIALLGSTGSIGVNALNVIRCNPEKYRIVALTAGKNTPLLFKQIQTFKPKAVAVLEEQDAMNLKQQLVGNELCPEILFGPDGFKQLATLDGIDTVISAMTGSAGLFPTFEAIRAGKDVALANKETMVMAGQLVMSEATRQGTSIIPVDSEHSAIFQSLQGNQRDNLKRVFLTASGGPFKEMPEAKMVNVTAADALRHPNWDMGRKITVDSATMMNKGLEVIEAKWLFNLAIDQIGILVHPQSIVHSMVEYVDGAVIAQLGVPDMAIPISYALSWPNRIENDLPSLDFEQIKTLTFEKPDTKKFRCLALALSAAKTGQSMPAVLNGANEVAVEYFLKGRIGFMDIPDLIERTMDVHEVHDIDSLEAVLEIDKWAKAQVREWVRD
jgi:1-deoxy-D-xylulose-5-phosphate reductoisomerase